MDGDKQTPISIPIASLVTHPDQYLFDGTLDDADEHALREDLRANGQRDPIKILADGTIVDGHQRVRLLQEQGHSEVLAIMVELDGDENQQRVQFLQQNMSRRQLSPLQHARLELRLYEANHGLDVGEATNPRRWGEVKAVVRHRIQGSSRHVNRVLRVVLLPDSVIFAVEQGRLSMTVAEKLDKLDHEELAAVVEDIQNALDNGTDDINPIAKAYLPETRSRCNPDRDFENLCSTLESFQEMHGDHIGEMTARRFVNFLARLKDGAVMLDRLIAQLETIDPNADPFAGLADLLEGADD